MRSCLSASFLYLQRSDFVHDYAVFTFMYTHPRSNADQKLHFFHI